MTTQKGAAPAPTDFEELRKLAEAASPGPWGAEPPSKERATLAWIIRERRTGPRLPGRRSQGPETEDPTG